MVAVATVVVEEEEEGASARDSGAGREMKRISEEASAAPPTTELTPELVEVTLHVVPEVMVDVCGGIGVEDGVTTSEYGGGG